MFSYLPSCRVDDIDIEPLNLMRRNMPTTLTRLLVLTAVFTMSLLVAGTLLAEECPRGDLDSRFCDRDGDLVADPPTDPSKWLNPDTLYFTYTPVDDAEVHKRLPGRIS